MECVDLTLYYAAHPGILGFLTAHPICQLNSREWLVFLTVAMEEGVTAPQLVEQLTTPKAPKVLFKVYQKVHAPRAAKPLFKVYQKVSAPHATRHAPRVCNATSPKGAKECAVTK